MAPRSATPAPCDGLDRPWAIPEHPRGGGAEMAQRASWRGENGTHPPAPVVMLESWSNRDYALLDAHEAAGFKAAVDEALRKTEVE